MKQSYSRAQKLNGLACARLEFEKALHAEIVGQDEGVQALVDLYQMFMALD